MMFDDILTAARAIIHEHGFKELSMRALARAVGVTAPTLYEYFPSKDAVLDAIFLEAVATMQQDFDDAVAVEPTGSGKLQAIAHAYRNFARQQPDLFMLLFGRIDSSYRPGEQQKFACMGLKETPGRAVVEAIRNGEMRECDPQVAAHLLWTAVHGFVMLEVNQVLEDCTPEMLDTMFEQNLVMLNEGFRPIA
jgi:AcrR family transcriptional regulator